MPLTLELPDNFGLVLATATSTFFVNYTHFFLTAKYRKASQIKYPICYATEEQAAKDPKAYAFNCAQRAHSNFLENQPTLLGALLISGLRYPVAAAAMGATWTLGRFAYALGYTSKAGPKGRLRGGYFSMLAQFGLVLLAAYSSAMFVLAK